MSDSSPLHAPADNRSIVTDTLRRLGLNSDTLHFGLNFKATKATLPGFINRLRNNQSAMDLDISCMLYDRRCNLVDMVWFKALRDSSGAVRHQGDSINGKDRGEQALYEGPVDPEIITIKLAEIPEHVVHVALVLTSYYGQPLKKIEAGHVHLSDDEGNSALELDLTTLPEQCNALWVASLRREIDDWHLTEQNLSIDSPHLPKVASWVSHELARSLPTAGSFG